MIPPFEYKYQNPTGFACLVLIRAIAIHNLPYDKQFNNRDRSVVTAKSQTSP